MRKANALPPHNDVDRGFYVIGAAIHHLGGVIGPERQLRAKDAGPDDRLRQ